MPEIIQRSGYDIAHHPAIQTYPLFNSQGH